MIKMFIASHTFETEDRPDILYELRYCITYCWNWRQG